MCIAGPTHLLSEGFDILLDPIPHFREVFILDPSQGRDVISPRVSIGVLLRLIIDLEEEQGGSEAMQETKALRLPLTKDSDRFSRTALFSPTSTNITAGGECSLRHGLQSS